MSDTTELLDSVRDIHEPTPPESSSALVIGGLILLFIALALAAVVLTMRRRKRPNRQLQAELSAIEYEPPKTALVNIAVLLRRVMHHIHGDSINQLEDQEWLQALDSTFHTRYFTEGAGRALGTDIYKNAEPINTDTRALSKHVSKLIGKTHLARAN